MPTLSPIQFRAGSVLPFVLGAVALGGVILVSVNSFRTWSRSSAVAPAPAVSTFMLEPTALQLEVAIRTAGLTPERLAAAAVSDQEVAGLVTASRSYLAEHFTALASAEDAAGTARTQRDTLRRLLESGLATEQDIDNLETAQSALDSAMTDRGTILAGLYTAAVAPLSANQKSALALLKGNSAWDLPTPYLAANRTQAEWVLLRDDLANLRIAASLGEDPDPACQQRVTEAGADQDVSAAATNLSSGLGEVQQTWTEEIGG